MHRVQSKVYPMQFEHHSVQVTDREVNRFAMHEPPKTGIDRRGGGLVERVFLLAPDRFGPELEPHLKAARTAVLATSPEELEWRGAERELERDITLAKGTLGRRIAIVSRITPLLQWSTPSLFICVPCQIPGANSIVAIRLWLPHARESVFARGVRVRADARGLDRDIESWNEAARRFGADPTIWRCELSSVHEMSLPIALEIAPNPQGFLHAMFIAHRGAAGIVVGTPLDEGRTNPGVDEPLPFTRLLPSGWNYLRPDRSQISSRPVAPDGVARWSDGVWVPDEDVFLACARRTWAVSLDDAMRVAMGD